MIPLKYFGCVKSELIIRSILLCFWYLTLWFGLFAFCSLLILDLWLFISITARFLLPKLVLLYLLTNTLACILISILIFGLVFLSFIMILRNSGSTYRLLVDSSKNNATCLIQLAQIFLMRMQWHPCFRFFRFDLANILIDLTYSIGFYLQSLATYALTDSIKRWFHKINRLCILLKLVESE